MQSPAKSGTRRAALGGAGPLGRPSGAGRILALTDPEAADPAVGGAKAANLAQAAAAGLPVLPGVVLTTEGAPAPAGLRAAWDRLSQGGARTLVVRSSSTVEDAGESSMAGQFRSVLGVGDWDEFRRAVEEVLASARRPAAPHAPPAPMAVLVQPELHPVTGGVLFGVEPVTGDARRLMVEAVHGSPHALVSGEVTAARYVMTRRGRVVEPAGAHILDWRQCRRLARLARSAERVFGRPQDVEWAFDAAGRLWMLQSRPVTATGHSETARGPLLGPGPVSETFPAPLRPLEVDLWIPPLRHGILEAITLTHAASRRRVGHSPVVAMVGGRVAVDLELLGAAPARRSLARTLDPRGPARRLAAAWRVGRLRADLPASAAAAVALVDRDLVALPPLTTLDDAELVRILCRIPDELLPLHAREVLAGMLLPSGGDAPTAAAVALAALAEGRAAGLPDSEITARSPVVLALTAPRVGRPDPLPPEAPVPARGGTLGQLNPREALRLRARWVQELAARAATELGDRLVGAGRLAAADLLPYLHLDEQAAVACGAPLPDDLADRALATPGPPLPAGFRLTGHGDVVAVAATADGASAGGRPAGGGRGAGQVRHDPAAGGGGVLVVETLSPELAGVLPGLAGLVSETGSTLSHLAILAREFGVPTVVGVPQARRRYPEGAWVLVDGGTGEIAEVPEPQGAGR
jgi:rifampicin phosphotransferase